MNKTALFFLAKQLLKQKHQSQKAQKPSFKFMWSKISHIIAFGFGSGLASFLPGTVGTLGGWLAFHILNLSGLVKYNISLFWLLCICVLMLGSWASAQTQQRMLKLDSGHIVIDEWLGIWICLAYLYAIDISPSLWQQFIIFINFRIFDMLKPFPIRAIEQKFKQQGFVGGFGIMIDDVVAAIFAILLFNLFR
jgi:phosphatidylglycerophosphatase A